MASSGTSPDALRERIPVERFSFRFSRSPGPGGQNVNKVNTRVTLLFDVEANEDLTQAERRRIRGTLHTRVSVEGVLRVISSRHRTQRANREAAMDRFYELLSDALTPRRPRKSTRPPASAKRRRLEDKRIRGERKRLRGRLDLDGAR